MKASSASPLASPVQCASDLLDRLGKEMHKAAKKPDAGSIHDARVAIRRMRECLKVFAAAFPKRPAEGIDKKLSKTLKAAGDLRNLDIAIELLKTSGLPKITSLVRAIREVRDAQSKDFKDVLAKLDDGDVTAKWKKKLTKDTGDAVDPLQIAHDLLPRLAAEFFDAGALASDPSADPKTMHKFRIQAKKFRYTLELFALDDRLEALRKVQTLLGDINDCAATKDLLKDYRKKFKTTGEGARKYLDRKASVRIRAFRAYWQKTMDAAEKDAWVQALS